MQDLKVTLIQTSLYWENAEANLQQYAHLISQLQEETHLIVLPEMFSTGFSMRAAGLAEPMDGKTMQWMRQQAAAARAVITGSLIIRENNHYYNRLVWMRPDGSFACYDKRHMFRMANEDQHFTPGKSRLIVTLHGWRFCPQVCYDLRFPVWNRNRNDYDAFIIVANWPERRNFAWKHLLQARAIENQAYVIGVNRIGTDGNGVYHSGDSALIDPLGEVVYTEADTPFVKTLLLSAERLHYVRTKMPFLQDADDFEIKT
ncbi:MAG: hydrolase [Chitinophagales bacterium]|nr:MAG: hydrolase [Chitinophagales bacterium]